jgi:hypothetical protein
LQRFRVDERERQQTVRQQRRAKAPASAPAEATCHAPASLHKCSDLLREVMHFWDSQQTASRASFRRALPGILRRFERSGETGASP